MTKTKATGFLSPDRIWVIACHTFTQLRRMKVFYFLVVFAILMIGINFFEIPSNSAAASSDSEHLKMIKNMCFGSMEIFSLLFGISATALLIPKDIEDRTLYTILSKPVPRIDYLFGKLLGVLLVILAATLVMDLLLCIVVYARAEGIESLGIESLKVKELRQYKGDNLELKMAEIAALGVTWNMQIGILAIFLKTVVISSVALLMSTFSSSTLFTIIITFIVWAIGMFQNEAKDAYVQHTEFGGTFGFKSFKVFIALLFPDLQLFNLTDTVTQSRVDTIPFKHIVRIVLITFLYSTLYSISSWFVFRKKEF